MAVVEELVVAFNPVLASERVAKWRGIFKARMIMLGVTLILSIITYFVQPQNFTGAGVVFATLVVFNLVPLVWAIVALVMRFLARRELHSLDDSTALVVHRGGLRVREVDVPWRDLRSITTLPAIGVSPSLVITRTDRSQLVLPLHYLNRLPSEIDDAVTAFSGGRFHVETSSLGN